MCDMYVNVAVCMCACVLVCMCMCGCECGYGCGCRSRSDLNLEENSNRGQNASQADSLPSHLPKRYAQTGRLGLSGGLATSGGFGNT